MMKTKLRTQKTLLPGFDLPQTMKGKKQTRYDNLKHIGRGGCGEVHCARDLQTNEVVAIKIVDYSPPDTKAKDASKTELPTAFMERNMLRTLSGRTPKYAGTYGGYGNTLSASKKNSKPSSYVVEFIEAIVSDMNSARIHDNDRQYMWIVQEYCELGDLHHIMYNKLNRSLRIDEIKAIAANVVLGLLHIHNNNIVHRDIKPLNILVSRAGRVKICDFGRAEYHDPYKKHTYTESLITTDYQAPESFIPDGRYGTPVDIWGLGISLLELFHRKTPFEKSNGVMQYSQITVLGTLPPQMQRELLGIQPPPLELVEQSKGVNNNYRDYYKSPNEIEQYDAYASVRSNTRVFDIDHEEMRRLDAEYRQKGGDLDDSDDGDSGDDASQSSIVDMAAVNSEADESGLIDKFFKIYTMKRNKTNDKTRKRKGRKTTASGKFSPKSPRVKRDYKTVPGKKKRGSRFGSLGSIFARKSSKPDFNSSPPSQFYSNIPVAGRVSARSSIFGKMRASRVARQKKAAEDPRLAASKSRIAAAEKRSSYVHLMSYPDETVFYEFVAWCLSADPKKRPTARELVEHPFISNYCKGLQKSDRTECCIKTHSDYMMRTLEAVTEEVSGGEEEMESDDDELLSDREEIVRIIGPAGDSKLGMNKVCTCSDCQIFIRDTFVAGIKQKEAERRSRTKTGSTK